MVLLSGAVSALHPFSCAKQKKLKGPGVALAKDANCHIALRFKAASLSRLLGPQPSYKLKVPGRPQVPEPKTLKLSGTKPEALNPNLSETPRSPEQRLCSCRSSRLNSVIQLPQ